MTLALHVTTGWCWVCCSWSWQCSCTNRSSHQQHWKSPINWQFSPTGSWPFCERQLTAQGYSASHSPQAFVASIDDQHQQGHKTQVKGINSRISYLLPTLTTYKPFCLVLWYKHLELTSIIPISCITTNNQVYKPCGAFPDDQYISILVAFAMIVTGSVVPLEVQLNLLTQSNSMQLIAYVTTSRQVTTIHHFPQIFAGMKKLTKTVGWPKLWGWYSLDRHGGWDYGSTSQPVQPSLPVVMPVLAYEVLQNFVNKSQIDCTPLFLQLKFWKRIQLVDFILHLYWVYRRACIISATPPVHHGGYPSFRCSSSLPAYCSLLYQHLLQGCFQSCKDNRNWTGNGWFHVWC